MQDAGEIVSEVAEAKQRTLSDSALAVDGLAKRFGSTQALRSCSLDLRVGEVHAVIGENGSGKSTLVKILSGIHKPDGGTLNVFGGMYPSISSPRTAMSLGLVTVFQEVLVVRNRSVLDNVWMGTDAIISHKRSDEEKRSRARSVLHDLLGGDLDLDQQAGVLPLSVRQACCLARALVRDPKILILDEATSALDIATRDNLFRILGERRRTGASTIFISHRMDEITEICDRITVLRSGVSVKTLEHDAANAGQLVELMTGQEHLVTAREGAEAASARIRNTVVCRTEGLVLRTGARPIDLEVRAGEIVGLAGLEGHGQDRFLRILGGLAAPVAGRVYCVRDGHQVEIRSPKDAVGNGVVYVPRDRRTEAIFESRSILDNFSLPTQHADRRFGIIRSRSTSKRFQHYVKELNIRINRSRKLITTLSGGNQQKVVTARWLASNPNVLLLNDPTRGVDLGAKRDIYRVLNEIARAGVSVILLSTEVDEHLELMDRIVVFREATVAALIPRSEATRTRLVASFFLAEEVG